jgi:hypothetical protein
MKKNVEIYSISFLLLVFLLLSNSLNAQPECPDAKLPIEWKLDPLIPAEPDRPTVTEAYNYIIDWVHKEYPKGQGYGRAQFGWLQANVKFTPDFTEVVFGYFPPRSRRLENPQFQIMHLNLLTGILKVVSTDSRGRRVCNGVTSPLISPDKKWVVYSIDMSYERCSIIPGDCAVIRKNETRMKNLITNREQNLPLKETNSPLNNFRFSANSTIFTAQYWPFAATSSLYSNFYEMELYRLDNRDTWIQDEPYLSFLDIFDTDDGSTLNQRYCGYAISNDGKHMVATGVAGNQVCVDPRRLSFTPSEFGSTIVKRDERTELSDLRLIFPEWQGLYGTDWAASQGYANRNIGMDGDEGFYMYNIVTHETRRLGLDVVRMLPERVRWSWFPVADGKHIIVGTLYNYGILNLETQAYEVLEKLNP